MIVFLKPDLKMTNVYRQSISTLMSFEQGQIVRATSASSKFRCKMYITW